VNSLISALDDLFQDAENNREEMGVFVDDATVLTRCAVVQGYLFSEKRINQIKELVREYQVLEETD
jgi:hypothetical protein